MTSEEKIQELAHIVAEMASMMKCVVPHNYRSYLGHLQERAEELAQEGE